MADPSYIDHIPGLSRSTDRTHRATTIDVTVDGTAHDVNLREAGHRTRRVAVVLIFDRCTMISTGIYFIILNDTVAIFIFRGCAIMVEVILILRDTRTTTIDITTVHPLWVVKVRGL